MIQIKKALNLTNTTAIGGLSILFGWCIVGYHRGASHYEYYAFKYNLPYSNMCRIRYGIAGTLVYMLPITIPIVVSKEIMRMDINIRNMEHEKKGEYYNRIL